MRPPEEVNWVGSIVQAFGGLEGVEGAPDGRMPFSFLYCKGVRGTASLAIHYENMVETTFKTRK